MLRRFIPCALPIVAFSIAACGGTSTPVSPVPTASPRVTATAIGAPPAALSAITPAPGVPTVPAAGSTVPPTTESPTITTATSTAAFTPVPAPSGSDLAALTSGKPPSTAFFAALAQTARSPYTTLSPTGPRAIGGTITGFSNDGIDIAVSAPIGAAYAAANGLPYASGLNAAGAPTATVLVTGQTFDFVPGGYGALRVGNMLLAVGKGPANAFQAGIVLGGSVTTTPPMAQPPTPSTPVPSFAVGSSVVRRADSNNAKQRIPFVLATGVGLPSMTYPLFPNSLIFKSSHNCVAAAITPSVTAGDGVLAAFPMEMDDISTPQTYVEATAEPLPIRLLNGPIQNPKVPQYSINYGAAFTLDVTITLNGCNNYLLPNGSYLFNVVTVGQDQSEFGYGPAPGQGATLAIEHKNCAYIGIPLSGAQALLVNAITSPSIEFCQDDYLQGGPIKGAAQIDNAKLISTPDATGMTDTTWNYISQLPSGDPQVTLMPTAADYDASVQPNLFQLQSTEYDATDYASVELDYAAAGAALPLVRFPHVPLLSVFQNIGGSFKTGVTFPQTVLVTLTPSEGTANVTGK